MRESWVIAAILLGAVGLEQECWSSLPGSCIESNLTTCFGSSLPYTHVPRNENPRSADRVLELWTYLQRVPKCWNAVRPLLCSLYVPKCDAGTNKTLRVSTSLCKALKGPCRVFSSGPDLLPDSLKSHWAEVFRCNESKSFCEREIVGGNADILKFPESHDGSCFPPLVPTRNPANYFKSIDGCGLRCRLPDRTPEQYGKIRSLIAIASLISLIASVFASATLLLDWKHCSYPNVIIFYLNLCGVFFICGWGAQFFKGDDSIVCNPDGTRRVNEPGSGQDLACVTIFTLAYYFGLAASLWFAILAYSWSCLFNGMGQSSLSAASQRDILIKQTPYFHILAWSVPAILTIAVISLNGVEGNPLTGICFVRTDIPSFYFGFVILPIIIVSMFSGFFISTSIKALICTERSAVEISGPSARSRRIRSTTVKILVYSGLYFICFLITSLSSIWIFDGYMEMRDEALLKAYFGSEFESNGRKYSELKILPAFLSVITSASWVWNKNSLKTWRKFLRKRFNSSGERMKDIKVRKHELITQAFAKRRELAQEGRLSLTFESSRFDPVGVGNPSNFDDHGAESSGDFSSTWAAALPRLVQRRGALVGGELVNQRRSSLDESEVSSINRSRFSWIDSRRQSFESQASSIPAFDLDRLQAIYDRAISSSRKNPKKRHKRKLIFSSSSRPDSRLSSRRDSIASSSYAAGKHNDSSSSIVVTLDPRKLQDSRRSSRRFLSSPKEFFELKEKLKILQTSSVDLDDAKKTAHNLTATTTVLSAEDEKRTISVQTSLTDLSGLCKVVRKSEIGTQTLGPPEASDSSSQTLPPSHPIEPVVIRISDEDSGSFPSSGGGNQYELFLKDEVNEPNSRPPIHNRGRRGAIIETSLKYFKEDSELCRLSAGVLGGPLPQTALVDTSSTS